MLIIISFLLIKFYRIQEFGNDYQAIILLLFSVPTIIVKQFLIKFYNTLLIILNVNYHLILLMVNFNNDLEEAGMRAGHLFLKLRNYHLFDNIFFVQIIKKYN